MLCHNFKVVNKLCKNSKATLHLFPHGSLHVFVAVGVIFFFVKIKSNVLFSY